MNTKHQCNPWYVRFQWNRKIKELDAQLLASSHQSKMWHRNL